METIFQGNNLLTFAVVLLAIVATWNTLWSGYKNYMEAKKPSNDLKTIVTEHAGMLDRDNKRLRELEDSSKLLLRGLSVLLEHEIKGNHVEQLEKVKDDINEYLINR